MSYPEVRLKTQPLYRLPKLKHIGPDEAFDAVVWRGKKDPTSEVITVKLVKIQSHETVASIALLRKQNGEYWAIPDQQKLGIPRPEVNKHG